MNYELMTTQNAPVKMWTKGVPVEDDARQQLINTAKMPFIFKHIAVMPDVHLGKGSTIGSVIPTKGAIIPAAVGVDIGCGMNALRTSLTAADLPENLAELRSAIEAAVPHGRTTGRGRRDVGAWGNPPANVDEKWAQLEAGYQWLTQKYPRFLNTNNYKHLGTLGTGNHFIEICLDETDRVWIMLHSGSRGIGNAIGTYFIGLAQQEMQEQLETLPSRDLAYFNEGSEYFDDYLKAVHWAQQFASLNREAMMENALAAVPYHVGEREVATLEAHFPQAEKNVVALEGGCGPGNALSLMIQSEQLTELFAAFGVKGTSAEAVANQVAHEARRYLASPAAVGEHLADQLILPLALAGEGAFTVARASAHLLTNIAVVERFLPVRFSCEATESGYLVRVSD
ncbi:hypothetical protein CT923_10535 [Salmonella enterica]|nr:hypothetical protein [Salmonella enterica]